MIRKQEKNKTKKKKFCLWIFFVVDEKWMKDKEGVGEITQNDCE